jgi:hypothetical protein
VADVQLEKIGLAKIRNRNSQNGGAMNTEQRIILAMASRGQKQNKV